MATREPFWFRLETPKTAADTALALGYRAATSPFLALYGCTVLARRALYQRGMRRQLRLPRPTVSIGNLLAGGTGKTPLVRRLCADLVREGVRPAVLLRGYRSGRRGPALVSASAHGGDEAALLSASLPSVPIAVGARREESAALVLQSAPVDLFLLDDGFQHLRVARDLDVVLIDCSRSHAATRLLPWGRLREPLSALRDAEVLCATHCGRQAPAWLRELAEHGGHELLVAEHIPGRPKRLGDGQPLPDSPSRRPWMLVTGVGHPHAVQRSLREAGYDFRQCWFFADHHDFTLRELSEMAEASGEADWLITAKDAVRLGPVLDMNAPPADFLRERVWVVDADVQLHETGEPLLHRLLALAGAATP